MKFSVDILNRADFQQVWNAFDDADNMQRFKLMVESDQTEAST